MVLIRCWCTVIIKLIRLEVEETIKVNKVSGPSKVLVHSVIIRLIRLEAIKTLKFIKSVVLVRCWYTVIIKLIS